MTTPRPTVVLTDYAWPDTDIERDILSEAGYDLAVGPAVPAPEPDIDALVARHDPVAIMTCWARVSATAIRTPSALRVVTRMGVGLDNIDVRAATEAGVAVTNVTDYCTDEVSDHAVALILNWTRGITAYDRHLRSAGWSVASVPLGRLREKTVGIVGFGRIGRATAAKLAAFGCRILVHSPRPVDTAGVEFVSLPTLLGSADVVVMHAPLTPSTRHLMDARHLAYLRKDALLVNVSRGGLIDTEALVEALKSQQLGSVALDVLEDEPTVHPYLGTHPNVVLTPHVAFSSDASVTELRTKATEDLVRVLTGELPLYPCNTPTNRT
ncbi:C-terminal binding protein [Mycolicibacterium fortuitum]